MTQIIKTVNFKKAPGEDDITNAALKMLTPNIISRLTNIANAILTYGHFPSCWKNARVVMIPKTGKDKISTKFQTN